MARKPRFNIPGYPQHVVQRGNNRQPCFNRRADYQRYLNNLHEAAIDNDVAIHAYILMTNHVHLLVTPAAAFGISHMMQDVGRKYVRYFNTCHQRSGTLWDGRFKASLVDSDAYLLTCMNYIEMNPVRAGMVARPEEYRWSSFHCNALGRHDALILAHSLYDALGAAPGTRVDAYRKMFARDMQDSELAKIRDALNQELVIGREEFMRLIERSSGRQVRAGKKGRPRRSDSTD